MIVNGKELEQVRADYRGQVIALRLGCYDVLHGGHQEGIDFAASEADILAVGVMPDSHIVQRKGRLAVHSALHRVEALDAAKGVDISFVVPGGGLVGIARTFLTLMPDIYVEGQEHGAKPLTAKLLGLIGVACVIDRGAKVASSSEIIARLGPSEAARLSSLDFWPDSLV